jgi:YggT family protein
MISSYLITFINILFDLMLFAIIARVLLSWMPSGGPSRIKMLLHDITEPILGPFRAVIPRIGMIDISPIVAIFVLDLMRTLLLYLFAYLLAAA